MRIVPRRSAPRLAATCALLVTLTSGGCYQHVVAARGFGADTTNIQQSNLPEDASQRTLGYKTVQPKVIPPAASR
jgi:hypothetical protein